MGTTGTWKKIWVRFHLINTGQVILNMCKMKDAPLKWPTYLIFLEHNQATHGYTEAGT